MGFEDFMKLEDLSVRLDGLTSMSLAIRDCINNGPNSAESYEGAIDLFANLMFEFKDNYEQVLKSIRVSKTKA